MQFKGLALVASAFVFAACGGGESAPADSAATPAMDAAAPAGSAMLAPVTGTVHEIKMIQDAQGYRFDPANITIKVGDGVKFTAISGFPHNVVIEVGTLSAAVRAQLDANFGDGKQEGMELTSKMFVTEGEGFTLSFANVAPGAYNYNCTPHLAMNMKGVITVQ